MKIGYSLRQAAKRSGVPNMTFHNWKVKGLISADVADNKGNLSLFSEAMIERAKELDAKRKAKKSAENLGNLFDEIDNATNDTGNALPSAEALGQLDDNPLEEKEVADSYVEGDSDADSDSDVDDPPADADPELIEENPAPVEIVETPITIDITPAAITLEDRANRIRSLQANVQQSLIEIGRELIAAKKEIGHGGWSEWLETKFDWTQQTANRFMRVAERFGKLNNVVQFKPSTLQAMLLLPAGDEENFIEAQSEAGKPVKDLSAREVQRAVKEWNQQRNSEETKTISSFEGDEVSGEYFGVWNDSLPTEVAAQKELTAKKPPIAHCTGNNEWHTPDEYIDAAREVLGTITLDPASNELANQTVQAEKFYSKDDDGLSKKWHGRIWLNPPFSTGLIEKFVDKLLASQFEAAIVLVDNATETRWFRQLIDKCAGVVFTTGRINFLKAGTKEAGSPTRGQAFIYFGSEVDEFFAVFAKFGWCAKITTPCEPE